jgi:competence ComEA-like helix-hairpin-helix protein
MDAAAPTNPGFPPPIQAAVSPPPLTSSSASLTYRPPSVNVSAVWPRSAQLMTAFLLGLAVALLGIQLWSMSRWSTRPLELDRGKGIPYRIDLNTAQRGQLLQVPGIGERTAEKIETYRQDHGPFQSKTELTQIPGIGPAKYEKIGGWVTTQPEEPRVIIDTSTSPSPKRTTSNSLKSPNPKKPSKKEEGIKAPIDVNQADLEELQKLPGIGPKLAQRIMDERAKSLFRTVEDLRRVSGIGPKILERLRPFVSVRPASSRVVGATSLK